MSKLIIVGHKNPDTDSIISAIAAQELFSKLGLEAQAKRAGEANNETKFILEKLGVAMPELASTLNDGETVMLVDHNEESQVFEDLDYSKISHIIDHHKMSIKTESPIFCRVEPIGSTSTLIAKIFFEKKIEISQTIAQLLMAGILSDTLNLTSPTTTADDKSLLAELNVVAKIDVENFVAEMFKAKSSLEGISVEDIIRIDYKTFEMGSNNVGVGTWETTMPASVNEKKAEIIQALLNEKVAAKLDYIFFTVVDILKQNCQLYLVGEKEIELAKQVFSGDLGDQEMLLPGVVSRKKQIVPQLTEALSK
ncbi:MAG: putative manganese-dependent inorganic pyrophosphatase [Candidatus Moranbacteria bacterium GW2011_GWA2_39_41]|nr:MAG: putative manganese-dependent inorganic pyrophosphatase [Candidatus Moranbacteria bacterium GW2011_GWA2_39_41]